MARVKTFYLKPHVPDLQIAAFITECEQEHYVNVTTTYIPVPDSPRVMIVVTKLDIKEHDEIAKAS
jgi:hypothetical protein